MSILVIPISIVTASSANAADSVPTNPVTVSLAGYVDDLAKAPNGDIWVESYGSDQIKLFSKDEANPTAIKTISLRPFDGGSSSAEAVSIVVGSNGYLYVLDNKANKVYIFDPVLGDTQGISDAVVTINVDAKSVAMALDSSDQIYVATRPQSGWVYGYVVKIYSADLTARSSANVRQFASVYRAGTSYNYVPTSMAVLPNGEVVILDVDENKIKIFADTATGADVLPIRTISDAAPDVYDPDEDASFPPYPISEGSSVISDSSGRIFLLVANTIRIFDSVSNGSTEPLGSIDLDSLWGENAHKQAYALTLGENQQIWVGDNNYQKMYHFDNPLSDESVDNSAPSQSSSENVDPAVAAKAAAEAAAKADAEARALAVEVAKNEIKSVLSSGKPLTADQLLKADINGVTAKNIDLVNADIAKLPESERTDIKQIEKVVLKFATVDKVAEGKTYFPADLVTVGLIPQESKIKASITAVLRKTPGSSLDTFEKIQQAIASVEKVAADRKARLAALLARRR